MKRSKQIYLSPEDAQKLLFLAEAVGGNPYTDSDAFVEQIQAYKRRIDLRVATDLHAFVSNEECITLCITGLPVELESSILTPTDPINQAPKSDFILEAILLALVSYLGEPFSFVEENFGHLVQNVFPIKRNAELQISSNASELTFHTDAAYHPSAPDYTALFCLRTRPEQHVSTNYASMQDAINLLDDTERELVKQPYFEIGQELSYGSQGKYAPLTIWSQKQNGDEFRFDASLTRGTFDLSQGVVDKLIAIIPSVQESVCLKTGDLLILKNLQCVHSRSAYQPSYDGADRWLQRVYILRDIGTAIGRVGHRRLSASIEVKRAIGRSQE